MIKNFYNFINEDDGGSGGVAYADCGTTTGMGNVIPSIPSEFAGDVAGATVGSGDRSSGFVQKPLNFNPPRKSKKKKKKIGNLVDSKVMSYDDYVKNLAK